MSSPGAGTVRQVLRFLPLFFLPFIIHFPTVSGAGPGGCGLREGKAGLLPGVGGVCLL